MCERFSPDSLELKLVGDMHTRPATQLDCEIPQGKTTSSPACSRLPQARLSVLLKEGFGGGKETPRTGGGASRE